MVPKRVPQFDVLRIVKMKPGFLDAIQSHAVEEDQCPGERLLLRALLERTLRDILRIKGERRVELEMRHRRDALKWIGLGKPYSADPDLSPFSFQWVCWHLSLDPEFLHRKLTHAIKHRRIFHAMRRAMQNHGFRRILNPYKIKKNRINKLAA